MHVCDLFFNFIVVYICRACTVTLGSSDTLGRELTRFDYFLKFLNIICIVQGLNCFLLNLLSFDFYKLYCRNRWIEGGFMGYNSQLHIRKELKSSWNLLAKDTPKTAIYFVHAANVLIKVCCLRMMLVTIYTFMECQLHTRGGFTTGSRKMLQ